jgi:glycerophosphoryl diester phosphodiesterase
MASFPLIRQERSWIAGHRGAAAHAPENTMASFEMGVRLGADVIELDVHESRDGHLVVIHDPEVARTTDGCGRIKDLTLSEIKRLDAGAWFSEQFRGERVPSSELLTWGR